MAWESLTWLGRWLTETRGRFPRLLRQAKRRMNAKLNSAQQVAEFLGIKVDTLYHYARSGRIRGMKIGKSWKFSDNDLRTFLDSQRRSPSPEAPSQASLSGHLPPVLSIGSTGIHAVGAEFPYARIHTLTNRLANHLRAAGIASGDRVMVLMENSIELVLSCFAAWKIGAVLVTEDPAINRENLNYALHNTGASALILDHMVWENMADAAQPLQGMKLVLIKGRTFLHSNWRDVSIESLDMILGIETDVVEFQQNIVHPSKVATVAFDRAPFEHTAG